jgi:plasmid maintenance system antidote protein VapI
MTNAELLSEIIDRQGITISELSRRSGVSRKRIYAIKNEGSDATASEIVGLASALLLSDEERDRIFLSKNVTVSN